MKGSECKFVKYMDGSDKRFVISVYQRNYDWKTSNCKHLYDDLVKIIKERFRAIKNLRRDGSRWRLCLSTRFYNIEYHASSHRQRAKL